MHHPVEEPDLGVPQWPAVDQHQLAAGATTAIFGFSNAASTAPLHDNFV